jgi:hypothetical protein
MNTNLSVFKSPLGFFLLNKIVLPATITSKEAYDNLFMIRHDTLHYAASFKLSIPFGERHIHEIKEFSCLENNPEWDLIKNQSPDIIDVHKDDVRIFEFSVSISSGMSVLKKNKYKLLISLLEKVGFKVELIPIVIHPDVTQIDSELLIRYFKFSDDELFDILSTLNLIQKKIQEVQMTDIGKVWSLMEYEEKEDSLEKLKLVDKVEILNYFETLEVKPFIDSEDMNDVMKQSISEQEMNSFFDEVDNFIDDFKPTLMTNTKPEVKEFREFHKIESGKAKTNSFRSYLPLPHFPSVNISDTDKNRSTADDNQKVRVLRSYLSQCNDGFLSLIGKETKKDRLDCKEKEQKLKEKYPYYEGFEDCYLYKRLTKDVKESIALDGPGRRAYCKKGSVPHIDASNKYSNHWMDPETHVDEIDKLAFQYSNIEAPSLTLHPSEWKGPGLSYLKFCQEIFREININCLRGILNKRFILKPTRITNVFIILHPGPLLRTAEQASIIWFKIIYLNDKNLDLDDAFDYSFSQDHWKSWKSDKGIMHSNWLSVDSHRLDHYLRCYDKVLMAYLTYIDAPGRKLVDSILNDQSNTLGIMILIYLEDKRSTSKMIQDARYIVMNNFSFYRYGKDLLEKLKVPIRTPLQLMLMNRMVDWITMSDSQLMDIRRKVKIGKVRQDFESGVINDRFSGLHFKLPRLFTSGPDINFDQLLHEMYFCMLFNKDQDDPTHSSFQILSKILEGEKSLQDVKETTSLHIGSKGNNIKELILHPHKNQFSRTAIMIGSILQSRSIHNSKPGGIAHSLSLRNQMINKTLDDFATFKSSSMLDNEKYNKESVFDKQDSIDVVVPLDEVLADDNNTKNISSKKKQHEEIRRKKENRQNRRRRCVQGVFELIDEGYHDSFGVMVDKVFEPTHFQIFKKNQIGGVREIVILDIKKRIIINVLESLSRCICKYDSREMLTHGDVKNQKYHSIIRNLKIMQPKGKLVHLNFDKSRWGPSFQSIQFLYLFTPFKKELSAIMDYIIIILMNHTNKRFILPEKLIRAWISDPEDKYKHWMDPNLQALKLNFLKTQDLTHLNESNMGQGILHYTSSLLHLTLLSFRDELVSRVFKKRNIKMPLWSDLLSSDDSYTCISIDQEKFEDVKNTMDMFLRCQEISERLFNCWTSTTKSSISPVFYEFNSLFGAGLGYHPTTIKFSLSSVDVFCTDSFYRLVKESYNACRQLIENGASLEIYNIAHKLNKVYCEFIFHTQKGGANDFRKLGFKPENVPYQIGIYPVLHPALMLFFGPEAHNYEIVLNWFSLSKEEQVLFENSHRFVGGINLESYAEMSSLENIYTSLMRIEAVTTPSILIKKLRSQIYFSEEQITGHIENDPLILFRKAKTMEEVKLKISLKLHQNSSIEAARQVSSALFFGRMSAAVSAQAFTIPGELIGRHTFMSCIKHLMNLKDDEFKMDCLELYPDLEKYKSMKLMSMQHVDYLPRLVIETKNVIKLEKDRSLTRLENPINKVLESMWNIKDKNMIKNSIFRDFKTLKNHNPFIKDTLHETIDNLMGDGKANKCKLLCLLLLRLTGVSYRPMKMINYGESEKNPQRAMSNLIQYNYYTGLVGNDALTSTMNEYTSGLYEDVFYHINKDYLYFISTGNFIPVEHYSYNNELVLSIFRNPFISKSIKRSIFFMMIAKNELDDFSVWSKSSSYIMHEYIKSQKKDQDGKYTGDGIVKVQLGSNKLILSTIDNTVTCNTIDPSTTYHLLNESIKLLKKENLDIKTFKTSKPGSFYIHEEKVFSGPIGNIHIDLSDIKDVNISCRKLHYFPENNSFSIEDSSGKYNMTIFGWAIPCDLCLMEDEYTDFEVFGLPFTSIIKIRALSPELNWQCWTPIQLARMLTDLKIKRPVFSTVTAIRLNQNPERWCNMKDDDSDDEKEEMGDMPVDSFTYTENYEQEMMLEMQLNDDKKIQELLKISIIQETITTDNPMESWIMDAAIDIAQPLEKRNDVNLSFIISSRLVRLKHNIIVRSICEPSRLNKSTIHSMKRKYSLYSGVKYVMWALFFVYEQIHSNTDEKSPRFCVTYENSIISRLLGADESDPDELEL